MSAPANVRFASGDAGAAMTLVVADVSTAAWIGCRFSRRSGLYMGCEEQTILLNMEGPDGTAISRSVRALGFGARHRLVTR